VYRDFWAAVVHAWKVDILESEDFMNFLREQEVAAMLPWLFTTKILIAQF
jgi:hypothetical protein